MFGAPFEQTRQRRAVHHLQRLQRGRGRRAAGHDLLAIRPSERGQERIAVHQRGAHLPAQRGGGQNRRKFPSQLPRRHVHVSQFGRRLPTARAEFRLFPTVRFGCGPEPGFIRGNVHDFLLRFAIRGLTYPRVKDQSCWIGLVRGFVVGFGRSIYALDGKKIPAFDEVRTDIHQFRFVVVAAGSHFFAVDEQFEAVIASRDRHRFGRRLRQVDLLTPVERQRFGLLRGASIFPNPFRFDGQPAQLRIGNRIINLHRGLLVPHARHRGQRVEELLAGQPAQDRSAENKFFARLFGHRDRGQLISLRGQDQPNRVFEVIAIVREVRGEPVEQVLVPRRVVHFVRRLDQSAAHEPRPESIHDRARQPPVFLRRDEPGEFLQPLRLLRFGINVTQLRINELRFRELAGRLVAVHHLQRLIREYAGQSIRI